jgi:hypothetical protein
MPDLLADFAIKKTPEEGLRMKLSRRECALIAEWLLSDTES